MPELDCTQLEAMFATKVLLICVCIYIVANAASGAPAKGSHANLSKPNAGDKHNHNHKSGNLKKVSRGSSETAVEDVKPVEPESAFLLELFTGLFGG
ncbi:unnamed protein product [Heterobilharzia americana]|nr:unnamed protein product [Heterobilharzia americana]